MKPTFPLQLEVEEIEHRTQPGCGSSSTNPKCTCPVEPALSE